jgi:hypothetical protein
LSASSAISSRHPAWDLTLLGAEAITDGWRVTIKTSRSENIFGIRTQRWKYVKFSYFRGRQESFDERRYRELFDLDVDPGEKLQRRS